MPPTEHLEMLLVSEVERLHKFISDWFSSGLDKDRDLFVREFENALAPQMVNIQPSGQPLTRQQLSDGIFNGHGSNEAFTIEIHDLKLIHVSADQSTAVATYVEHQKNAKNTDPPDNQRMSTVVFGIKDDKFTWLHLHETAVK